MLHLGGKIRETMWSMFHAVLELSDWGDFWIASIKSRLYVRGCDVKILSWFGFAATWRRVESLLRWLEEGHRPLSVTVTALSAYMRHYWCQWDNLELRGRVLFHQHQDEDGTGSHSQCGVPKSLRDEVLRQMHDSILSGRLGRKKRRGRNCYYDVMQAV